MILSQCRGPVSSVAPDAESGQFSINYLKIIEFIVFPILCLAQ